MTEGPARAQTGTPLDLLLYGRSRELACSVEPCGLECARQAPNPADRSVSTACSQSIRRFELTLGRHGKLAPIVVCCADCGCAWFSQVLTRPAPSLPTCGRPRWSPRLVAHGPCLPQGETRPARQPLGAGRRIAASVQRKHSCRACRGI